MVAPLPVPLTQKAGVSNPFFAPVPVDYDGVPSGATVPAPPSSGDYHLISEDGVLSWEAIVP